MSTGADIAIEIRPATEEDVGLILSFIRDLARFEDLLHEVTGTEEEMRACLFGADRFASVLLAHCGGVPAGLAVFYFTFSTFAARPVLFLEDLFVTPEARGSGVGKALFARLVEIALERNCARLEWTVLRWNQGAIRFYEELGATAQEDWTKYRLSAEEIGELATRFRKEAQQTRERSDTTNGV